MGVSAVFGISGVGKSWMISRVVEKHDIVHVQGSALIREARAKQLDRPVDSEELRTGKVTDNQALLVVAFEEIRARESRDIIFDGHNVIDTDEGWIEISFDVIQALGPRVIIVITDDPAAIVARRGNDTGRTRPMRDSTQLAAYQNRVVEIAFDHAARLQIPFVELRSGATAEFEAAVLGDRR